MSIEDFYRDLPAIWLVYAGPYLNHKNKIKIQDCKPKNNKNEELGVIVEESGVNIDGEVSDQCEKLLLDLLLLHLKTEFSNSTATESYGESNLVTLNAVYDLLKLWSDDLELIYDLRQSIYSKEKLRLLTKRLSKRIADFDDCTIIPNGLYFAEHTGGYESVNLAILEKSNDLIDWTQINPGGLYHQHCPVRFADETRDAFFKIADIDPSNITEEWLHLLIGLKAVRPGIRDEFYMEKSLYECLLAHLNGKTVFKTASDEGFLFVSHSSPTHTWQVIELTLCYLLYHFFDKEYNVIYGNIVTGFKIFLMEKTFSAYQDENNKHKEQCHYLLQEMCRETSQQALDHGSHQQKNTAFHLIEEVKKTLQIKGENEYNHLSQQSHLDEPRIKSLNFITPSLLPDAKNYNQNSFSELKVMPLIMKPNPLENAIDYLKRFKQDFVDKLVDSNGLREVSLLSYGIEIFFVDYLAETDILQKSIYSFSSDDTDFAKTLKELAEIYYCAQGRIVRRFLSGLTYDPQYYAKNLTIQFFVYVCVASLALRNEKIRPLLEMYNLSTDVSYNLKFNAILPHLVINDAKFSKVLMNIKDFFAHNNNSKVLFASPFNFRMQNNSDKNNVDVEFAYELLKTDYTEFQRFTKAHQSLDEGEFNRKWAVLTFNDSYLPSLYKCLSEVAYIAKVSLTGFPSSTDTTRTSMYWRYNFSRNHWYSFMDFKMEYSWNEISTSFDLNMFTFYKMASTFNAKESYQHLVTNIDRGIAKNAHFTENEIVASQHKKPASMDCLHYMQLGFLQSESLIKLERLYIAIKEQQLDFSNLQDSILIKQTLFEISEIQKVCNKSYSLLEWAAMNCPLLIHKLGLLCTEKAMGMKFRLTQHHAIGEILQVVSGLLTLYPEQFRLEIINEIVHIYEMLKTVVTNPPDHLSDRTLSYLNVYLIISVGAQPTLIKNETKTILGALFSVQKFKVKGIELDNITQLQMNAACFSWCKLLEKELQHNLHLLDNLMIEFEPQWQYTGTWKKNPTDMLFTCGDYAIEPLLGIIYFRNQVITGLPDEITQHATFKDYLGEHGFAVFPNSCIKNNQEVACYLSVDKKPQLRLTIIKDVLFIDEWIENDYHSYIPAKQLSKNVIYPNFFYELPNDEKPLRHWLLKNNMILIKSYDRQIIYEFDLQRKIVFSLRNDGYVIPLEHMYAVFFMKWLKRIESFQWIEIIAKPVSEDSIITIESLHFPRLGLHFKYENSVFFSRQIHDYYVAEQQQLNTLHGFSSYLILEKKSTSLICKSTKVIIPHRVIKPIGPFYQKTVFVDLSSVQSPSYFVYDVDKRTGLLKANNISAHLYLALLYYCSASLDDFDASKCNSYHLARENLELCWKDQLYDENELTIIEHLLSDATMRDFHSCRIALYLKVVSLLINSLRLAFLYLSDQSSTCLEKSEALLKKNRGKYKNFLSIYIQNKSKVFARIRLDKEEEQIIKEELFKEKKKDYKKSHENYSTKSYKTTYKTLFWKKKLKETSFVEQFLREIDVFKFSLENDTLDFSKGIEHILVKRFSLQNFIGLYKIAKTSKVSVSKYKYLLHHLVLKPVDLEKYDLYMMLARALLLVAENPMLFPEPLSWFDTADITLELSNRSLTEEEILNAMPEFHWIGLELDETEEKRARKNDNEENDRIWLHLKNYDLNNQCVPILLPSDEMRFTLRYENYVDFSKDQKKEIVRDLYLQAAHNDSMYKFFVNILNQCDDLKLSSNMGWTIASFQVNSIQEIEMSFKSSPLLKFEIENLERLATKPSIQIDTSQYFKAIEDSIKETKFLFESQITNPDVNKGYKIKFYEELYDSWMHYHKENKKCYDWLDVNSLNDLEQDLLLQYSDIQSKAKCVWNYIENQFKCKPNSESDQYFALQWYSGQVVSYHNGNLLALLHEPQKIVRYNPTCLIQKDTILENLLLYVQHEIYNEKLIRALTYCDQYKRVKNESEKFSLLQTLVRVLLENIDPMSYQYPYWLLFQLENDIIVRGNQCDLISKMLCQTEKAMYQLNMGEGKSSVILPLLSYSLADGKHLLRINVLYSLLHTMKDFLRQRFSGLIRKRVYSLPFYRDTDISKNNLNMIVETLKQCQHNHHILLVTPEHRLCLQLKLRELMLENQQQIGATDIFDWKTYRMRANCNLGVYRDLTEEQRKYMLLQQDECLRNCLCQEKYIDHNNRILKMPPRGQKRKELARFIGIINDQSFREWSCLKAAYRELLYNSTPAFADCSEKLNFFYEIDNIPAIDLLDESDEILRHGTELNYTIGDKYVFDGGELRWHIPQFFIETIFCDPSMLDIITAGKEEGFTVLNENYSPKGGVPFIQFLSETYYENHIKPSLVKKFFLQYFTTLRKYGVNENGFAVDEEISCLKNYVSGELQLKEEQKITEFLKHKSQLKDALLIAKGWLSHGILFHILNSKYRVQYGLYINFKGDLMKQIAIPFWGKDAPSPRSEFSHPDVMLGYTIICYLYEGLNLEQLKETLIRLKNKFSHQVSDKKLKEWAEASRNWIESQDPQFPPLVLKSFEYIDLEDELCLTQLHKYISCNYQVIFFYLNEFVLLEEAMQYRYKISANAHSLVGYNFAMGFSGTDDRKLTLPFQVKSLRSDSELGTNGKLLYVLTEERNSDYYSLDVEDTSELLKQLCDYIRTQPYCHAIIDSGALITGMTNYEVALFLLVNLSENFQGILYFSDERNSLTVLTRDKETLLLQDCYLDKQYLFAYLDDVHTRGTDIKLPLNCQAILTIGLKMEKDKLMQASMRLRQLAQKQSVSLWGTKAVTLAISRTNEIDASQINSLEVIKWVTFNTIEHINKDLFPVALRKVNFEFLKLAKLLLKGAPTTLDTLISYCQEKELFHLDEFYAFSPQLEDFANCLYMYVAKQLRLFWLNLEDELKNKQIKPSDFYINKFDQTSKNIFRERLFDMCNEIAAYLQTGYVHNNLDNDQEKEMEMEVEVVQEQNVLISVDMRNAMEEILWDVQLIKETNFIDLADEKNIIMPLSAVRDFIQLPADLKNITWHPDIYMTRNYINSVQCRPKEKLDNYLRPIDAVLLHRADKISAILLSGKEAAKIKLALFPDFVNNLLVHLDDINGPTQLPNGSIVSKMEQKLFTIIKLFSGDCQYSSNKEVQRLSKRVGRLYPTYFTNLSYLIDCDCSLALYGNLIENGYLDYAGIMTEKLFEVFNKIEKGETASLQEKYPSKYCRYFEHILKKLYGIYNKLIVDTSQPLKKSHYVLWQWIATRGKMKHYPGSDLEKILNSEYQIKC